MEVIIKKEVLMEVIIKGVLPDKLEKQLETTIMNVLNSEEFDCVEKESIISDLCEKLDLEIEFIGEPKVVACVISKKEVPQNQNPHMIGGGLGFVEG
ncbi:MAG: hypothetical protein ACOCP4_07390 [Candidatus Woesearchaeota archaeon]